ncbi:hypothetical protein QW060_26720 [Myroides ceti]|uniref:Uncharacterized protein n=1 Tax=Paenimyroides ceti TaxID=395087 RepID=A0ABT8D1L0_9FLAO|nr:hypothetical protein [Paenimyroides ceti]MDN3710415.1 hypothetical protein [Paenimyroides ceti]
MHQKPLTDKQYLLEKFAGKGGWTFVRIPEIAPDRNRAFGWVRVSGHMMILKSAVIIYSLWAMEVFFCP